MVADLLRLCSGTSSLSDTEEAALGACGWCATRECWGMHSSASGGNPLVREEGLLPQGVTAYPLEYAPEEQTISLPWLTFFFLFLSPLRKCLFLSLYIYM